MGACGDVLALPVSPCLSLTSPFVQVLLWVVIYYASSAASGVWNKWLVEVHVPVAGGKSTSAVSPAVLTLLHLLVALVSDVAIMRGSGDAATAAQLAAASKRTLWGVVGDFGPIAVCVVLSKVTTYLSYQYVSIALAHTAKASEPVFNVIVAALFYGEWHSRAVYASLAPITLGIVLASVSDLSYNHTGFAIAVASALLKVLQNIATKRVMASGAYTFWETHYLCGVASLLVLTPLLYWENAHSPAGHSFVAAWAAVISLPLLALAFDSLLQWASSVSAYVVLSLVSHLTATIISVMKRLLMISVGVWAAATAGGAVSSLNVTGVVLAIGGVLWYNLVVDLPQAAPGGAAGGAGTAAGRASASGVDASGGSSSSDAAGGAHGDGNGDSHTPPRSSSGAGGGLTRRMSSAFDVTGGGGAGGGSGGVSFALFSSPALMRGVPSGGGGGGGRGGEGRSTQGTGAGAVPCSDVEQGGGGGDGESDCGDERAPSMSSRAVTAPSAFLTWAVVAARRLGVPRHVIASAGLLPQQLTSGRGSERRSSSGEWADAKSLFAGVGVGGASARPRLPSIVARGGVGGNGGDSSSGNNDSDSERASLLVSHNANASSLWPGFGGDTPLAAPPAAAGVGEASGLAGGHLHGLRLDVRPPAQIVRRPAAGAVPAAPTTGIAAL